MIGADAFRDAIRAAGLTPPDMIEPGRFHRFPGEGKRNGNTAGWCKLFADGLGGVFGDYSSGFAEQWQARREHPLTLAERESYREHVERARAEAEAARREEQAQAARKAAAIWKAAPLADDAHPYLVSKRVKSHKLRLHKGLLVVPMRDASGELYSLQFISPEKPAEGTDKNFLSGGRKAGCYFSIGKPDGTLCIAEGYATGASIHEATGHAVAIAVDAGNLQPVALSLRAKLPDIRIILCADDDYRTDGNPGVTKATEAARAVGGLLALPDFGADRPDGATDFNDLARRHGAEPVKRAVANARAPDTSSAQPASPDATAADLEGRKWPDAMDEAALHGIAGEFVRMVEPNTEADPAAVLLQFLVAFGALVGRGPHYRVEGDQHHANLFALLVGATAKGRKGTSWGRVREVFESILGWKPHVSGLSSGEGLKYHVRDAREETKKNNHGESVTEVVDEGVTDKRLLVVESEFASALRNAQKPGNTLSAAIREGWDSGTLRTLTKNDPVTATGAHISIIGHITDDELRADLTATDSANGFANRFLFVAVRRSKQLPFGGEQADVAEVRALSDRLGERAETAHARGQINMTADARKGWAAVYATLSAGGGGLHGAVTARAEAQVIRLALVYCLLDGADQIDVPHLRAALAVWQYCDATAKHVFGASIGDRIADEILRRLQRAGKEGLTRTGISDVFKRHQSAERIGAALELLREKGQATCETISTGGRPSEVWRATQ